MTRKTSLLSALFGAVIVTGVVAQKNTPVDPATLNLGQRMLSCCRFRGHEDKIVTMELESG